MVPSLAMSEPFPTPDLRDAGAGWMHLAALPGGPVFRLVPPDAAAAMRDAPERGAGVTLRVLVSTLAVLAAAPVAVRLLRTRTVP
jgi:hypothetical protein